jgi:hypothetical protein
LIYPFDLWGQPLLQIEYAEVGGRRLVVARGGPPGAEVRVFDANDGSVVSEYSIGSWKFQSISKPIAVSVVDGGPVLSVAIDHRGEELPGLGRHFVRQFELVTGAPAGPSIACSVRVVGLGSYSYESRAVLVIGGEDGGVVQHDVETGEPFGPVLRHVGDSVSGLAVYDGGRAAGPLVAIGSRDGALSVWDAVGGRAMWSEHGSSAALNALDMFATDEQVYLATWRPPHVEIRDAITGAPIGAPIPTVTGFPVRIGMGPLHDRPTLYLGHGENLDRIDIESGERLGPTIPWPDEISAVRPLTIDGREILFVVDDYVMCKLDAATGEVLVGWVDRG